MATSKEELLKDIEAIKNAKSREEINDILAKYKDDLEAIETSNATKAKAKKTASKSSPAKEETEPKKGRTYTGKYEIYQTSDGYAYRLKASNGEILVTSETYASKDSLMNGIKALQSNVENGDIRVFADKKGKYKFKLVAKNNRVMAISASYSVEKSAIRASESFKKFALSAKIVEIELEDDSYDATPIDVSKAQPKDGGKFVISKFNDEFSWDLKASNGQILCQAEGYNSKASALSSIEAFKSNIKNGQFKCIKDKNGHYCYKLYLNNRVCAVGESYTTKQSAESAANSVVSFAKKAIIEEEK